MANKSEKSVDSTKLPLLPKVDPKKGSPFSGLASSTGSPRDVHQPKASPRKSIQSTGEDDLDLNQRFKERLAAVFSENQLIFKERQLIAQAEQECEELTVELMRLEAALSQLTTKIQEASTELIIANKNFGEQESQLKTQKDSPEEKQQVLEVASLSVKEIQKPHDLLVAEKEALEKELATIRIRLQGKKQSIDAHSASIQVLEDQQKQLEVQVNRAQKKAEGCMQNFEESMNSEVSLQRFKDNIMEMAIGSLFEMQGILKIFNAQFTKLHYANQELQRNNQGLQDAWKEMESKRAELTKLEQTLRGNQSSFIGKGKGVDSEVGSPLLEKTILSDIAMADSPASANNIACQYLLNKLFEPKNFAAIKGEFSKIGNPKFPRATTESFARFLASKVSHAFEKTERALLNKIPTEGFKEGIEREVLKTIKETVLEKLQSGGVIGLEIEKDAQLISFIGTAIGAIENPVRLLKKAPDNSWRNSILRTLAVGCLSAGGGFKYESFILSFSDLPKIVLDLVSVITKYAGDATVPLLCAVLGMVIWVVLEWFMSRQKRVVDDNQVLEKLIIGNMRMLRV
jgi:hypothetical protein